MPDTRVLQSALQEWRRGSREALFAALGYEPLGVHVPHSTLQEFGLCASDHLQLEIAARHRNFAVFRICFEDDLAPQQIVKVAESLYRHNPLRRALLLFVAAGDERIVFASWGLGPGPFRLRKLWIDPRKPRPSELDILADLAVNGAQTAADLALAHARALDRERVTRRFFSEFRRQRAELAAAITGVPSDHEQDRLDLALVLLSRLLFLYFIQRKGWLAGDHSYLLNLYQSSLRSGVPFYRRRLKPLFFAALNRSPDQRGLPARELGELPYLNGGLFERIALERKHIRLDVPDDAFASIFFELLEHYQFTLREDQPADQDVAVDPEMLGKVFEGLMTTSLRGSTGAFFTPRALVDRLVDGALSAFLTRAAACDPDLSRQLLAGEAPELDSDLRARLVAALARLRVLDPAVGSGAFLLAALNRVERLRDFLEGQSDDSTARFNRRQAIIQRSLHGVDINGAAVRLCELRLWLALVVDLEVERIADVPPLPNLDINIRQGDALLDPIDFLLQLTDLDSSNLVGRWTRAAARLAARKERYFCASGQAKRSAIRALRRAERKLALTYLAELSEQLMAQHDDLETVEKSPDLFGAPGRLSRSQKTRVHLIEQRIEQVRKLVADLTELDELPFFSFAVHFADPDRPRNDFDVILGNPPWIRAHRWASLSRARLKQRFEFLREAGWRTGVRLAGAGRGFGAQLDLSALFLERSLDLLGEGGALGFLMPAKLIRALYGSAARARLVRRTRLLHLEDCSLAARPVFAATTYPLAVLLIQERPSPTHRVGVRLHTRGDDRLEFELPQRQLPLLSRDAEAPWALAPPLVRDAIDRMLAAGPPLGFQEGLRPSRGIVTGCNSVFVGELADADAADGLATLLTGRGTVSVDADHLRPVLRGEDLTAWTYNIRRAIVWTHDDSGQTLVKLPPATSAHLLSHEATLLARKDLKPGQRPWTLFRVDPKKWALRVAWRDIAAEPAAVVIPRRLQFLGDMKPAISLNTVYQISASSESQAHLLAAVLNSSLARSFLISFAERASGGYFRFLGWTVALLPFPSPKRINRSARRACVRLSHLAHERGVLKPDERAELDRAVARIYALDTKHVEALLDFAARLSGRVRT